MGKRIYATKIAVMEDENKIIGKGPSPEIYLK